ncbi:hypothetical protein D9M68_180310 [compost metagenome]
MELPVGIEEGQGSERLVHHQHRPGVALEPAPLLIGQHQFGTGDGVRNAGSPAALDDEAGLHRHAFQRLVDDAPQAVVGGRQGEAEAASVEACEIQHAQVEQITLADHVLRAEGIPHIEVGPAERNRLQGAADRIEADDPGARVVPGYFLPGEVVVHHRDPASGQAVAIVGRHVLPPDDHRLVGEVRDGKDDAGEFALVSGGTAQQIYLALLQRLYGAVPAGIAAHLDADVEGGFEDAQVIRGDAFQLLAARGGFQGRIVRAGGTDYQDLPGPQPLPVRFGKLDLDPLASRTSQQVKRRP